MTGISASQFVERYFQALAERGIRATVIHGYQNLPDKWDSDIDFSVPDEALSHLPAIGVEVAEQNGWGATRPIHANLFAVYQVFFSSDDPSVTVQIDACSNFVHSGCFLLSAEELQADCKPRGLFHHTAPAAEFAYHLGKSLAKKRPIARTLPRLRELAALDPAGCSGAFQRLLSDDAGALEKWINSDAEEWDRLAPVLQRRRRFGPWLKLQESLRLLRRSWSPHGILIVVLGPDGAGKSTLIEKLTKTLACYFRGVEYVHSRPSIFDPKPPGGVVSEPHAQPPRSWLGSVAKTFYYIFDHLLGYAIRLRPALVRNRAVIFDRDFHDVIVDPTRYRMKGIGWLARAMVRLLPKANITIVLDAPPEVIHGRKPELTIPELTRQREVLSRLAEKRSNWRKIDASQPPESVARKTIEAVLEKMRFRP